MEKLSEPWQGKHIRDLLAGASISYIPQSKNGKNFGSKGWGSGKTKLLIAKKNKLWCLYILETGEWEQVQRNRAKTWFESLTDKEKARHKVFTDTFTDWRTTHPFPIDSQSIEKVKTANRERELRARQVIHKANLLKSMYPDHTELDDAEVIKLFCLFDPKFDDIQNQPNDLNVYGDSEFVFLDDRYSCIAGKERLSFTEAEEVCMRMIAGE